MENLRYEIYLEDNPGDKQLTRMDIYSHVKREWIYNSPLPLIDVFLKLKSFSIKQEISLVHISESHSLYNAFAHSKWTTKHFQGLSGQYATLDGCIYDVSYQMPKKPPFAERVLTAQCIKSKVERANLPFLLVNGQIERNLKSGTFKRIEQ